MGLERGRDAGHRSGWVWRAGQAVQRGLAGHEKADRNSWVLADDHRKGCPPARSRGRRLAALPAAQPAKAACLVQAGLLPLGAVKPPVPQVAQNSGPLHRGLETPEQPFTVFPVTERHECQSPLLEPVRGPSASTGPRSIAQGNNAPQSGQLVRLRWRHYTSPMWIDSRPLAIVALSLLVMGACGSPDVARCGALHVTRPIKRAGVIE